jgi:hypothetical protein
MEVMDKRKPRSYKTTNSVYDNAMEFAKKKKTTLAEMVEVYVSKIARLNQKPKK